MDVSLYNLAISYITAYQKYRVIQNDIFERATGSRAMRYDIDRVQSSVTSLDKALVDYAEIKADVEKAFPAVIKAFGECGIEEDEQESFVDNLINRKLNPMFFHDARGFVAKQDAFVSTVARELLGRNIRRWDKYFDYGG